jgi:hypothetical protein
MSQIRIKKIIKYKNGNSKGIFDKNTMKEYRESKKEIEAGHTIIVRCPNAHKLAEITHSAIIIKCHSCKHLVTVKRMSEKK